MRHLRSTVLLAVRDLWHERVLTTCLLLSVSAILGPLLLLFGLKNGIIDTLRERLLRDPASREIHPRDIQSKPFPDDWFTRTAERPEVEFVVPRLDVAGDLKVRFARGTDDSASVSAICEVAEAGDPRLEPLGIEAPKDGQVALTRSLAGKLGVREGEEVMVLVDRGGLSSPLETAEATLVVGALVAEPVPTERAWLPLSFLVGVRDFREYLPVPEFGWPGTEEALAPVYDAVLTLSNRVPERVEWMELTGKPPGLADARAIDPDELFDLTGIAAVQSDPPSAILWRAVRNTIPQSSVRDLGNRLAEIGIRGVLLPLIDPLPVSVELPDGETHRLKLLVLEEAAHSRESSVPEAVEIRRSLQSAWRDDLFPATVEPGGSEAGDAPARSRQTTVEISDTSPLPAGEAQLLVDGLAGRLELPVHLVKRKRVPEGVGLTGALPGGQIRRALAEPILYQAESGGFRRKRGGFRDFRLFAATLEDVAPLAREFEAAGIPVRHAADRIDRILELDANLTRLFWIVASAAAGAGFFGLVASFFASVERKRRDLGILQLLGMPRPYLFAFPMLQSAFLSLGAYALAFCLFRAFADLIDAQFASDLREGESFCSLRQDHALGVLKATLGFGLAASLAAAARSCRIQPSEALRSE